MIGDGAIAGKNIELGAGEPPPGLWNLAIGDESFVDDVLSVHALAPFAFEIKRVVGGQQAGTRNDLGLRRAAHVVEDAGLGVDVVFGAIAVELGPVQEIFIADVAPRLHVAGVVVVIHRVGIQLLVDGSPGGRGRAGGADRRPLPGCRRPPYIHRDRERRAAVIFSRWSGLAALGTCGRAEAARRRPAEGRAAAHATAGACQTDASANG